ncbi:unnamed protein product [Spirodela intermedia]|uniref:Uncharacterized protein n=1 Tax=Spirodela intermedia TaxID=51605 RepID=A0A7I8KGC5_SPIIN|nr:unnamed protein product [Spirodela intermedia]
MKPTFQNCCQKQIKTWCSKKIIMPID